jgi:hypothetical protein
VINCAIEGPVPVPAALPEVIWRAGIDLNQLDVSNPADVRWLETLIWPEQDDRRQRLAVAIAVARADPPYPVAGDLNDKIGDVASLAADDATGCCRAGPGRPAGRLRGHARPGPALVRLIIHSPWPKIMWRSDGDGVATG